MATRYPWTSDVSEVVGLLESDESWRGYFPWWRRTHSGLLIMHLFTPALFEMHPGTDGVWLTRVWFLGSVDESRSRRFGDRGTLLLATEVLANRLPQEDLNIVVRPSAPWEQSVAGAAVVLNALGNEGISATR